MNCAGGRRLETLDAGSNELGFLRGTREQAERSGADKTELMQEPESRSHLPTRVKDGRVLNGVAH